MTEYLPVAGVPIRKPYTSTNHDLFCVWFRSYLFVRALPAKTPRGSTQLEPRHWGRVSGAICAVCRAWQALKAASPAGMDKTNPRSFSMRGLIFRTYRVT